MFCSVFTLPPHDFQPHVEVAGCYCEYEDKVLFLKRHPSLSQGNTWGIPGGKFEEGEDAIAAVVRELQEEVGLSVERGLQKVGQLYMRIPHADYIFHIFRKRFDQLPALNLALNEHVEARWVTLDEALKLNLIAGGKEVISYFKLNGKHPAGQPK